jgi:hypothetical protein
LVDFSTGAEADGVDGGVTDEAKGIPFFMNKNTRCRYYTLVTYYI